MEAQRPLFRRDGLEHRLTDGVYLEYSGALPALL